MIQRIQSVYLLLASAIMLILFFSPIAQLELKDNIFLFFYHNRIEAADPVIYRSISVWPVSLLLIIIVVVGLYAIFQFRNRIRQIRLCVFNIILHFGLIGLIYFFTQFTLKQEGGIQSVFLWPVVIPFISMIITYIAFKKIQKDEMLIRSVDRLRK